MTGPIEDSQDEPLDPETYRHHLLILKSAHCCRPVLYRGLNKFVNGLSLYSNGGGNAMAVYLAGMKEGIDSKEIQIPRASPSLSQGGTEPIPD